MFNRTILALLILLMGMFPTYAQNRPSSLLGRKVSFSLPGNWVVQKQEDTGALGKIQISIPYPETDDTPHSAGAALIARTVPKETTVKQTGDRIGQNSYEGLAIIEDIFDSDSWRSILWTARDGVPYIMMSRFGVSNGISVELLVSLPLLDKGNPKVVEKTIAGFNALVASLKINGHNVVRSQVVRENDLVFMKEVRKK